MKRLFVFLAAITLLLTMSSLTMAQKAKVGEPAPDFKLVDSNGKEHNLSDFKEKYVVLEWVNFGCPFVKKHYQSGNMQKLQKTYRDKEVIWLSICSSASGKQGYYEGKELQTKIEKEKSNPTAYLLDAEGKVGKMYGAKTTPHMYVIDPKGILIYAGGIDDKPTTKLKDVEGATNYVTAALDSSMVGKAVEVKTSTPYGCSVKYK
jgi:peroxiredoxin